jgi:chemotaxis protein MotB
MADNKDGKASIILIKKKKGGHGGHHGGAWKVAYADFVTAMMAFFMVMWLMGSDEETKKAVADYFNNPDKYISASKDGPNPFDKDRLKGNPGGFPEDVIPKPSKAIPVHVDEQKILLKISEVFEGSAFSVEADSDHVKFALPGYILFQSGSSELSFEATLALKKLQSIFHDYPGKIFIEGHTNKINDNSADRNSWKLSFDRAMSVRNFLVYQLKIAEDKVVPVPKGDAFPYSIKDVNDQKNRRVEFILKHHRNKDLNSY